MYRSSSDALTRPSASPAATTTGSTVRVMSSQ